MIVAGGSLNANRSKIVTTLAWLCIIGGAFTILGGVAVVPIAPLRGLLILVGGLAALVNAVGLKARREWARLGMIAVLCYGVATTLGGGFLTHSPRLPNAPPGEAGRRAQEQIDRAYAASRGPREISAVVFAAIDAMLIALLASPNVREEFDSQAAA